MTGVLHDMQLFWFGSGNVSVVLISIGMRATEHEVEVLYVCMINNNQCTYYKYAVNGKDTNLHYIFPIESCACVRVCAHACMSVCVHTCGL